MLKIDRCPFRPTRKEISKKRLAGAARSIEKEKCKLPLFAHEVTTTPIEKVEASDTACFEHIAQLRCFYLQGWLELRRFWGLIPQQYKRDLEAAWLASAYPKTPTYAFEWLVANGWCKSTGELVDGRFVVTHEMILKERTR